MREPPKSDDVRRVIRNAIRFFSNHHWARGALRRKFGRDKVGYCTLGALRIAASEDFEHLLKLPDPRIPLNRRQPFYMHACNAVAPCIPKSEVQSSDGPSFDLVPRWNDRHTRTKGDVMVLLVRAEALLTPREPRRSRPDVSGRSRDGRGRFLPTAAEPTTEQLQTLQRQQLVGSGSFPS